MERPSKDLKSKIPALPPGFKILKASKPFIRTEKIP